MQETTAPAGGAPEADPPAATRQSWGFPAFARSFPRDPELDALVAAFTRGDYAAVREGAPKLASTTRDDEVKRAATLLRDRIEPDRSSMVIFLVTGALLAFLTAWWVAHDGPEGGAPAKKSPPAAERAD